MDWSPKVNIKQKCCTLGACNFCNSGQRSFRYLPNLTSSNEETDEFEPFSFTTSARSSKQRWLMLWRRLQKGRRRIFNSSAPIHTPYDPYTYAQNFDHGSTWVEPENLSRSFSARYAGPSSIFRRMG